VTSIAGNAIPNSGFAREATEFLRDTSTRLLFDHSRRVFLWASLQAEQLGLDYDAELLYVGAMFHDVGLLGGQRSEHERFEIDGANAARAFLERHGLPEEQVMTVWQSIALHTTRQVPNYLEPEVRLVALGVQYDVLGSHFDTLTAEQRDAVLAAHPRTGFKTGMIEASRRASATSRRPPWERC
jgi:HD domain